MSEITEFSDAPKCPTCGNAVAGHWNGKPCLTEYVQDVAHSRQRAAAVRRAEVDFAAACEDALPGALFHDIVAEILARHGVTAEEFFRPKEKV